MEKYIKLMELEIAEIDDCIDALGQAHKLDEEQREEFYQLSKAGFKLEKAIKKLKKIMEI